MLYIQTTLTILRPETQKTGTLANREDPDEMTHYAAFHQSALIAKTNPLQWKKYDIFWKL